jgi:lipopolysaccharide export system permease protein
LLRPGDSENDRFYSSQLIAEGHRRLATPLYILAYALVGLAALLLGDFNRRGQTVRILAAISVIVLLQLAGLSLFNLSRRMIAVIPLTYALPIVTIGVASFFLFRERRTSTGSKRREMLAAPGGS